MSNQVLTKFEAINFHMTFYFIFLHAGTPIRAKMISGLIDRNSQKFLEIKRCLKAGLFDIPSGSAKDEVNLGLRLLVAHEESLSGSLNSLKRSVTGTIQANRQMQAKYAKLQAEKNLLETSIFDDSL